MAHIHSSSSRVTVFITTILVIAILYFAKDVLIPLALAILLSFVLVPVVQQLQRWRFGRVPATLIVTVFAFAIIGILAWALGHQLINLAQQVPQYKQNLLTKIRSVQSPLGSSLLKTKDTVQELSDELTKGSAPDSTVQKVEVVPTPLAPLQILRAAIGPVVKPLGTAVIVIVFVIFMLLYREDLRDRVIRLIGSGQLHLTTQALDDAAERVSRFILMQIVINGMMGICIAIGLLLIGVPNAILWGFLSAALRFIPYLGPWLAAVMPITLSLAFFNSWSPVLMTVLLFAVLELITNNILEPWLYGSHTGLSPVALIVAAVFWSWLWGAIGLLLSTPLTVCLVVMGKYIPQLEFLDILLGDQPVLNPGERFYQRLVAMNPEEAEEILQKQLKGSSFVEVCDTILIPTLHMAELDRSQGGLDEEREESVFQNMKEIIGEMIEQSPDKQITKQKGNGVLVLCLPAQDQADEIAAQLFSAVLQEDGIHSQFGSGQSLTGEQVDEVDRYSPGFICISAVPPAAVLHSRYLSKRIRSRFPQIPILVGLWNAGDIAAATDRLKAAGVDEVVTNFEQGKVQVREMMQSLLLKNQS